jgi:hypothetical protein
VIPFTRVVGVGGYAEFIAVGMVCRGFVVADDANGGIYVMPP